MKKEEKLQITKDKLVDAAYKLMKECNDPSEVTSRAIAQEADVKLAMVNYCFGSREELLFTAAMKDEAFYKQQFKFGEILEKDLSPKEKLRQMYYAVGDYLINSYKFTKALTGYVLLHRDLASGLTSYPLVKAHYGDRKEDWEVRLIAYELSSMMQLMIFRAEELSEYAGIDIGREIKKIIDIRLDLLLED